MLPLVRLRRSTAQSFLQATYTDSVASAHWLFDLAAFLLGLLLGSFLNVCISRLPEHRSISKPRSHCPRCLQTIRWYDNIPLLSWILLRARCRHCKASIPSRYPAVELVTGVWFGLNALLFTSVVSISGVLASCGVTILGFLLIGLIVMDWQTHTLPDAFTLTGIALGFLLVCTEAIFLPTGVEDIHLNPQHGLRMNSPGSFAARGDVFLTGPEHLVFGRLAAILAAAAIPLLIRALYKAFRKREGMGLGDTKLLAMIAAFLGFWPAMLALFLGVLLCAVYAAVLLARRRAEAATALPLGSFLAGGGLVAALLGEPMMAWYRGLL